MRLFALLIDAVLDFLFPKTKKVIELEKLTPSEIMLMLPPAPPMSDEDILALWSYENTVVRDIIWELKYRGNTKIADKVGVILYDLLEEELQDRAMTDNFVSPVLIPMPISDKRRFERGWNQAELISDSLKRLDRSGSFKYLPRQLAKLVHTESQTKTGSKKERLSNIHGTMRVLNPESVRGRSVILIDDVTTTGATFAEAKRALREAGAKKILCIALAH